jgi:hypothetical protein
MTFTLPFKGKSRSKDGLEHSSKPFAFVASTNPAWSDLLAPPHEILSEVQKDMEDGARALMSARQQRTSGST